MERFNVANGKFVDFINDGFTLELGEMFADYADTHVKLFIGNKDGTYDVFDFANKAEAVVFTPTEHLRDISAEGVFDDSNLSSVDGALKKLFLTKADIDPNTHKILLSQIPDTIVGGLDSQGTYNKQSLPTAEDKRSNDVDSSITTQKLVKGDFWWYNGIEWDITSLVEDGTIQATPDEKKQGIKYVVKKGDLIVYNGENKWGIIDNTDEFIGIRVVGAKNILDGEVLLNGNTRNDKTEIKATQSEQTISFSAPLAALIENTGEVNKIYKEAGDRFLVESGLTDDGNTLDIENKNAQIDLRNKDINASIKVSPESVDSENFIPKESGILLNDKATIDPGEWIYDTASNKLRVTYVDGNGDLNTDEIERS